MDHSNNSDDHHKEDSEDTVKSKFKGFSQFRPEQNSEPSIHVEKLSVNHDEDLEIQDIDFDVDVSSKNISKESTYAINQAGYDMSDYQTEHQETKLRNTRKWILTTLAINVVVDFTQFYPVLDQKPFFPERVAIYCQALVTYPTLIGLIYSYWTKKVHHVKWMLVMMILRM